MRARSKSAIWLTAEIVHSEPRIRNAVIYTAGDTITYKHFAEVLGDVLGVRFSAKIGAWPMDQTFNAQHHLATVSLEQWAREHREQLLAPR